MIQRNSLSALAKRFFASIFSPGLRTAIALASRRFFARAVVLGVGLTMLCGSLSWANAGVTSVWEVDSFEEFNKGESTAAFVTSLGEVRPGWKTQRANLEIGQVWATALDGKKLYLGTDKSGAVYRVVGSKVQKLANIPKVVAAVSLAKAGRYLYVGTMPKGEIWRIDEKTKKTTRVAKIKGAESIWTLAVSPDGRNLFAGTGPKGKLFRVSTNGGSAEMIFDTNDKRIVSMAVSRDGAVWFGTSEEALIFRYDPKTRTARAMADFTGNEVTALAIYRDGVVAAANDLQPKSGSGPKTSKEIEKANELDKKGDSAKELEGEPAYDKAAPAGTEAPRAGALKGKGALFVVRSDGRTRQLHALKNTYFTSVVVGKSGDVYAGAADKGLVFRIGDDDAVSTVFDVPERRVDHLIIEGKEFSFVTSDASALFRSKGFAKKATYLSTVFDAKAQARFGQFVWWGAGNVVIATRSGNTSEPGPGWSRWSKLSEVSKSGGGSFRGKVNEPGGRYLQYRVSFRGGNKDIVRRTALYYLPQNRATRITKVSVEDASKSSGNVTARTLPARSPVLTIDWDIENDDGDASTYVVSARREGEARWREVVNADALLSNTQYQWNTETYPDGYYRVRVVASDKSSNMSERAETDAFTTSLFLLDNTRPVVKDVRVKFPKAAARAIDGLSAISKMAYSIDDGPWQVGAPRDGIFDQPSEFLVLSLPKDLSKGTHTLAIRVTDEAGNIGAASVSFNR